MLVISKGSEDDSSSSTSSPPEGLLPASTSLLRRRRGEPLKKLISVAGEMAPLQSNSSIIQHSSKNNKALVIDLRFYHLASNQNQNQRTLKREHVYLMGSVP